MTNFSFIFPGQGSQAVGMMADFNDHSLIRSTFNEASQILNVDFWKMATEPNEEIHQTIHTQPILLTAGIATWRVWQSKTDRLPNYLAGHSLGEYTALVASNAMEFKDALMLVKYRAEIMQKAVPEGVGAMAAILGMPDSDVMDTCMEARENEVVEAVNFNSPGQVVIAGNILAVARAIEIAKTKGAKRAILLPVSVPSHCSLMQKASEELKEYLTNITIKKPNIPVIHNVDVMEHHDANEIKGALSKQLCHPVRWVDTIEKIALNKISDIAECGPGKVLTGLTKRISAELKGAALINEGAIDEFKALIQ
ncbi:ACP S-malonyltransferase [Candidatus Methylopumilus planktonicus]|uniref:ACP S-malonyltransferase n=1 Tax=Candidatus Methylopumilus planktonicus TaxID=1581557 RepID=UPI0011240311|nr:ACP S-malonyltransferase [Candidatus Methylopumilus planktonicus]QDD10943.1 ACP S-malonyltransferase [Candidatus Methylopumilus planktonicus]QDD23413.1 ACP S-malonyltransferase [Candidatus Methylopumilus planktonicus]